MDWAEGSMLIRILVVVGRLAVLGEHAIFLGMDCKIVVLLLR